jgi:transposase
MYRAHGPQALRTKKTRGPKSKLDDGQMSQLYRLIVGSDPRQLSFGMALWTRGMIQEPIRRQFGVRLSVVSVGNILAKLGMSPQRPLYRACEQDPKRLRNGRRRPSRRSRREPRRRARRSSSQMRPASGPTTTSAPPGLRSGNSCRLRFREDAFDFDGFRY